MPTDALNFITDGASSVRMKWREPYVTEGINKKLAGIDPRGIYRGFRLNTNVAALSVTVSGDVVKADHLAVYESTTGYSISVRRTGGDFTLNLGAYPATTVYIAIYVVYATLTTTQAVLRIYTAAEYAVAVEKPDLVVLGQVVVPGAGLIADTSIVSYDRVEPWNQEAPNVKQWHPIILNAQLAYEDQSFTKVLAPGVDFDHYPPGSNWSARVSNKVTSVSSVQMAVQNTDVPFTGSKAVTISASGVGPNILSNAAYFTQGVIVKVQPGDRLRVEFWYKLHQVPTVNGSMGALVTGANDAVPAIGIANFKGGEIVQLTAAGGWIKSSTVFEVTGTVRQALILGLGTTTDITFAAAGNLISFGPWQFWVESSVEDGPENKIWGHVLPVNTLKMRAAEGNRTFQNVTPDQETWFQGDQGSNPTITVPQKVQLRPHFEAGVDVWTQLQTGQFAAGFDLSGKTNADEQEQARFQASFSTSRKFTLLFESASISGPEPRFRIYQESAGATTATLLVYGAKWDNSAVTWITDTPQVAACRLVLDSQWDGVADYAGWRFETGQAPLTEAAWVVQARLGAGVTAVDLFAKFSGQVQAGESLAAIGTIVSEAVARIVTKSNTSHASNIQKKSLLVENIDSTIPLSGFRTYLSSSASSPSHEQIYNAKWNFTTSLWEQQDPAKASARWTRLGFGPFGGFDTMDWQLPGAAPWGNASWITGWSVTAFDNGGIHKTAGNFGSGAASSTATLQLTGDQNEDGPYLKIQLSNVPKAATPVKNALYSKNIPKAWAKVSCDGLGGVTLTEGFNVASVSIVSGDIVITFHNAFANAISVTPVMTATSTSACIVCSYSIGTTSVRMRFVDGTFFQISSSTNGNQGACVVFGEQT